MIRRIILAFAVLVGFAVSAQAQVCPTAAPGTNNSQCASTAFVQGAVTPFFITCPAHQWVNSIAANLSICSQPSVADISGGAALTTANDTNVTLTAGGSPASALLAASSITAGWTGTLAAGRLNSNVVQSVVNDTNVTGSIATQALTLGWTGTLAVPRGGTGLSSVPAFGVMLGNNTSPVNLAFPITAGNLFIDQGAGANPAFKTANGDISAITAAGAFSIANNAVSNAKFRQSSGLSVVGVTGTATANVADITGTAGQGLFVNTAGSALTFASFLQSGTGATNRSWLSKAQDIVNVRDFGAACDGVTDDTTAINNALATGLTVVIPTATCKITGTLNIGVSGTTFIGQGLQSSVLTSNSTTASMISVGPSVNVTISGMKLTRSVTATAGSGIVFSGNTEETVLSNLWVEKQFDGITVQTTNYSRAQHIVLSANQDDGWHASNTAGSGSMQWILDDILSQQNVNRGFLFASVSGPGGMTLGEMSRLYTFANSSFGFLAIGLAGVPINGIRMSNSFFGQDGNSEVSLDTHGGLHVLNKVFTELAGTAATGPTLATAASNAGSGFDISANNTDVEIIGGRANGNSVRGISSSASFLGVIGGEFTNNGAAGAVPGISILAASTVRIIGVRATGSPQNVGIATAAAAINGVIEGNDVSGTGGSISNSSTGTTLRILDNTGYNPVGTSAAAVVGASPATITAGATRETHYLKQTATNTATVTKGGQQVAALVNASTYYVVDLGPNESMVVTWATTPPTDTKDVH